jgi:recombination protein RecA
MVKESQNRRDFRSAVEFEIIKKAGSWFSYGETKLGQGRDAVKSLIKDNPELADEEKLKLE